MNLTQRSGRLGSREKNRTQRMSGRCSCGVGWGVVIVRGGGEGVFLLSHLH